MNYCWMWRVVADGQGHFVRIDTCSCPPRYEGDDPTCPVHLEAL